MASMKDEFKTINAEFKRLRRAERDVLLCAMIRVNYGTPWSGDEALLKNFLPDALHARLQFNGITDLIETISPFADEPTLVGPMPEDEITLSDISIINEGVEATSTSTITQFTRELPNPAFDSTSTIKLDRLVG